MADLISIQPGTIFAGDFRVVRPLSEGGMGAVYVVEQMSTGKERALKLMLPQLVADPVLRKRFEQEARIGARIESEHIVEVVGAGVDQGLPWLAMELLRGEDLAKLVVRRGALAPAEVLTIFSQLCHAVGAAHQAGIIHRDLKPENIFLAASKRADTSFTVKVLDFGIAKIVAEAKTKRTDAMGSPVWMAPEQTDRSAITPATDLWALGLIAFHLLTGRFFWRTANAEDTTIPQLMREMLFEPMPPATVRARELGVSVPGGFDAWFARCTERDPAVRLASAQEALGGLRQALASPPAPALAHAPTIQAPRTNDLVRTQAAAPLPLPPSRPAAAGISTTAGVAGVTGEGSKRRSRAPFVLGGVIAALLAAVGVLVFLGPMSTAPVDGAASAGGGSASASISDTVAVGAPTETLAPLLPPRPAGALSVDHAPVDLTKIASSGAGGGGAGGGSGNAGGGGGGGAGATGVLSNDPHEILHEADRLLARGDMPGAEALYERVLAKDPKNVEAMTGMGDISRAHHFLDSADADYREALTNDPNYLPALLGHADTLWEMGKLEHARQAYAGIVDRFPEGTYPKRVTERATAPAPSVPPPVSAPPAPTTPPAPAPPAPEPETTSQFDRGAAAAALSGVDIRPCKAGDGPTGTGHLTLTFSPNGRVATAIVDRPPFQGTRVGGCVAGKFRAARVPPFAGSTVTVGKSFVVE